MSVLLSHKPTLPVYVEAHGSFVSGGQSQILFQCRSVVPYDDVTKPLLVSDLDKLEKRSMDVVPDSGKHHLVGCT